MDVLVIEDDPRLSRLLGRLLEGEGHVVKVASDGATGLGIAGGANHLDCIILDIGLPDMSGLEVAKRLRSVGSEVRILILSARDTIEDRAAGFAAGADAYLVKPFAFDEVAARVPASQVARTLVLHGTGSIRRGDSGDAPAGRQRRASAGCFRLASSVR